MKSLHTTTLWNFVALLLGTISISPLCCLHDIFLAPFHSQQLIRSFFCNKLFDCLIILCTTGKDVTHVWDQTVAWYFILKCLTSSICQEWMWDWFRVLQMILESFLKWTCQLLLYTLSKSTKSPRSFNFQKLIVELTNAIKHVFFNHVSIKRLKL